MHLYPGLSRLSGVVLSGILLVGSVFVPSSSETLVVHPEIRPVALASHFTSTNITRFLNQQVHWNTVKPIVMMTATEIRHSPTKNVQNVTKCPQPVHIAQLTPRKILSEKNQISRGSNGYSTIVEHALDLLGTPYIFGGTTLRGIDCSGFTQYIFAGSGISLPRTSYEQFASGVAVNHNELLPGDLVFFTTYAKGASHVGIYIGDGRFIQAANPRVGVTVTSLSSSFYSTRYLGARRYI